MAQANKGNIEQQQTTTNDTLNGGKPAKLKITATGELAVDLVKLHLTPKPPGCSDQEWAWAINGAERFIRDGGDRALALGWDLDALYRLPSNWFRMDGVVVWSIGRWVICGVEPGAIVIKPPWSESRLRLYRPPAGGRAHG